MMSHGKHDAKDPVTSHRMLVSSHHSYMRVMHPQNRVVHYKLPQDPQDPQVKLYSCTTMPRVKAHSLL